MRHRTPLLVQVKNHARCINTMLNVKKEKSNYNDEFGRVLELWKKDKYFCPLINADCNVNCALLKFKMQGDISQLYCLLARGLDNLDYLKP